MSNSPRVAVLGAGIMGGSTALYFARRGAAVSLFDGAPAPFSGASRWNEGKIHLGFLYSADPTLRTAQRILPGGLAFKPLLEDLLGCGLDAATTAADDIYLCHRHSVVPPQAMEDYLGQVADLVRQAPDARDYLADGSVCRVEKLADSELRAIAGRDIVAGFRVPERSVATNWIADRFCAALAAAPLIEQHMNTRVLAVRPGMAGETKGNWFVETSTGRHGPFDQVINALWEGRMAVDATVGLPPPAKWSNRYRLALFVRTTEPVDTPSAVVAVGAYGDIKNYDRREFYLSWYPTGLRVNSSAVAPPAPPAYDAAATGEICNCILEKLTELMPGTARIRDRIGRMRLAGGWVFAAGQGLLDDPKSTLHRRCDFGTTRVGTYISVDTGKYSTAPWLARKIVEESM